MPPNTELLVLVDTTLTISDGYTKSTRERLPPPGPELARTLTVNFSPTLTSVGASIYNLVELACAKLAGRMALTASVSRLKQYKYLFIFFIFVLTALKLILP